MMDYETEFFVFRSTMHFILNCLIHGFSMSVVLELLSVNPFPFGKVRQAALVPIQFGSKEVQT